MPIINWTKFRKYNSWKRWQRRFHFIFFNWTFHFYGDLRFNLKLTYKWFNGTFFGIVDLLVQQQIFGILCVKSPLRRYFQFRLPEMQSERTNGSIVYDWEKLIINCDDPTITYTIMMNYWCKLQEFIMTHFVGSRNMEEKRNGFFLPA